MPDGLTPGARRMPNLNPLTDKQLRDAERDRVYIFNVSTREHRCFVGREYVIPARSKNAEVSEPLVINGTVYTTDVKKVVGLHVEWEWIGRDGIDVAREIVGTAAMLDPSQNLTPFGVFISMTETPSAEAIAKAREAWLETCSRKVADADRLASINGGNVDLGGGRSASNIGKDHRDALAELGMTREWAAKNVQLTLCDECGTGNIPTAAFCKQCDNMLNAEAAARKFPKKYAERMGGTEPIEVEPVHRGPGRPRKQVENQVAA